jgi:hypothetical protein
MAPVVWPQGVALQNRHRTYSVRGLVRAGSETTREILGNTSLDVGGGLLFDPAFGRESDGRLCCAAHVVFPISVDFVDFARVLFRYW